ncbi:hypothetical protein GCM10009678_47760 [Actinomadura kijaniata]|uniref:Cyclic nucleotide-binding domain-containing protein n=1 Tax=Actinomadura namibiensis TaxID=182080 RepID=A0A7W3QK22_ACTNM|nr:cyclic nucleotide-binding domain-containing protein [Actinomadura namibiensis]MBA8949917.1 hypothetical protein [Actinomadura namibiensis]
MTWRTHSHDPDAVEAPTRSDGGAPRLSLASSGPADHPLSTCDATRHDAARRGAVQYRTYGDDPVLYPARSEVAGGPALPPPGPPPTGLEGFGAVPVPPSRTRFWHALTVVEQTAFVEAAERVRLPVGHVLWHEGDRADHLLVILSGWVKVSVGRDGERIVALRGPADVIGERATLMLRRRSATVVVLDELLCLRMTTARFAAFLEAHPRVLVLLEQEIYQRLVENPVSGSPLAEWAASPRGAAPAAAGWDGAGVRPLAVRPPSVAPGRPTWRRTGRPSWTGQICSVLFTDIVDFSGPHRRDSDRREIRRVMYAVLREALEEAGVPWESMHREDRGDGALLVVRPEFPPRMVIETTLARLAAGLRDHNRWAGEARRIRLRAALGVGPVTSDTEGVNGFTIIQAARLLDSATLREWMQRTQSDLGFITSEYVYDTVVAQDCGEVNPKCFQPVRERVKKTPVSGWMHLSEATL